MTVSTMAGQINITLNGEARRAPAGASIAQLVEDIGLNPAKVAVERNLEIVPKSLHGATPVAEGDRIELVQFVGGG